MNLTELNRIDICIIALLLLSLCTGWRKGFLRSMTAPIFFAIFSIIGVIHFDLTANIVHTFLIVATGTLVSSLIFKSLFLAGRRHIKKDFRDSTFLFSRLLGSIVNLSWNGTLLLIALLIITITSSSDLAAISTRSHSYNYANAYIINRIPIARNVFLTLNILQEANMPAELTESPEYKAFFENPKVKDLRSDAHISNLIQNKNIFRLLSNRKVKSIFRDNALMQKLTVLSKKAYNIQANWN
jgi:hypothetical protein